MKFFLFAFVFITGCILNAKSQDTVKSLHSQSPHKRFYYKEAARAKRDSMLHDQDFPTVYVGLGFGAIFGLGGSSGQAGIQGHYDINYQYKRSLFTIRGLENVITREPRPGDAAYGKINLPIKTSDLTQTALLYGWRFTNNKNHAVSFSTGISFNNNFFYFRGNDTHRSDIRYRYAGVPFEANYGWYAKHFGLSFGFKLTGDISQYSFVGVGVNVGLGFHNPHK